MTKQSDQTISEYVFGFTEDFEKVLPEGVDAVAFLRAGVTSWKQSPDLHDCTWDSLVTALMRAAQLALEPGPLGHVWMVGRKNTKAKNRQVSFQIGYQGWLDLLRRHPQVLDVEANLVYEADRFHYEYGSNRQLVHKPSLEDDRGEMVGCYGYGKMLMASGSNAEAFEYWSISKIEAHRDQYAESDRFWKTNFGPMARKTMLLQVKTWMPKSSIIAKATAFDGLTDDEPTEASASDGETAVMDPDTAARMDTIEAAAKAKEISADRVVLSFGTNDVTSIETIAADPVLTATALDWIQST